MDKETLYKFLNAMLETISNKVRAEKEREIRDCIAKQMQGVLISFIENGVITKKDAANALLELGITIPTDFRTPPNASKDTPARPSRSSYSAC